MINSLATHTRQFFFLRSQQQAFLEDLGALIEDGVQPRLALETMHEIVQGIQKHVAGSILTKIAEGKQLADGMYGWFPTPIVEMIRAGEEGGTLTDTIKTAARSLSQQTSVITSFVGSTLYPFIVIIMALIVMVFVKKSVFTDFATIKPLSSWPQDGRNLVHFGNFVQHWWWIFIVAAVIGIFFTFRFLRGATGEARKIVDTMPGFSLYRDIVAARFMEILGMLMTNGIVFKKALSIMQHRASAYLAWHMYVMEFRLSGGKENIGEVIDTGLIKQDDILRLKVIALGRGFDHSLVRLGRRAAERNERTVKVTGRILGGIFLAVGAMIIAFTIFSIYLVGSFVAL